jgi:hypothetical protein
MAGYSETTLAKKLGIKPGNTICVLNSPEGFLETLGAELTHVRVVKGLVDDADVIHVFVKAKSDLESSFPHLKSVLGKPHALWISWPRKISGIETDLNENVIRDIGIRNGLVDVKVCAIDEVWSGLKFVYRLKDR